MSYSETKNDVEAFGYKTVFERLFYERATALTKLEFAKKQLKVCQATLDRIDSEFNHLMSILAKDNVIEREGAKFIIRHIKEDFIWQASLHTANNEIACEAHPITKL